MDEQAWNAAALAAPVTAPALRIWRYDAPILVLGPSQRSSPEIEQRAAAAAVTVATRMTGGGAVLAGPWLLGASVVLPPDHARVRPSLRESYRWLGEALAGWLAGVGVAARAEGTPPPRPDAALAWACFAGVSHWEVEVAGRKIVGLSQARRRTGTLLSAGVLVGATPWPLLCALLDRPAAQADELTRRTVSVEEALGGPPPDLAARFEDAIAAAVPLP
jgi:lipoate-protein ligase A